MRHAEQEEARYNHAAHVARRAMDKAEARSRPARDDLAETARFLSNDAVVTAVGKPRFTTLLKTLSRALAAGLVAGVALTAVSTPANSMDQRQIIGILGGIVGQMVNGQQNNGYQNNRQISGWQEDRGHALPPPGDPRTRVRPGDGSAVQNLPPPGDPRTRVRPGSAPHSLQAPPMQNVRPPQAQHRQHQPARAGMPSDQFIVAAKALVAAQSGDVGYADRLIDTALLRSRECAQTMPGSDCTVTADGISINATRGYHEARYRGRLVASDSGGRATLHDRETVEQAMRRSLEIAGHRGNTFTR